MMDIKDIKNFGQEITLDKQTYIVVKALRPTFFLVIKKNETLNPAPVLILKHDGAFDQAESVEVDGNK